MTDIVERLESYELGNLALQVTWVGDMREAATEIKRLRAVCKDKTKLLKHVYERVRTLEEQIKWHQATGQNIA